MDPDEYNIMALVGLSLSQVLLFVIIIYFCCKDRIGRNRRDSADQTEDLPRIELENMDQPPEYKSIVLRVDPPDFFESVINSQINPELNPNWAKDLHEHTVDPEIDEVINRSRSASICSINSTRLQDTDEPENLATFDTTGPRPSRLAVPDFRRRTASDPGPEGILWVASSI